MSNSFLEVHYLILNLALQNGADWCCRLAEEDHQVWMTLKYINSGSQASTSNQGVSGNSRMSIG
jgi:hypothetical protein